MCDIIKRNESDAGKIDFELQAKRGDRFLNLTLFFNLRKLISLQCLIGMEFKQKCSILNQQMICAD